MALRIPAWPTRNAATAMLLATTITVAACSGSAPSASTQARVVGATQSAVAAPAVESAAASAGSAWTAVSDVSAFDHGTVRDVTSNGSGFIAVGQVLANTDINGAIWMSGDGITWRSVPVTAPKATFARISHGPGGFVAASSACPGTGECIGYTFWSSHDGITWTQHGSDPCCWVIAMATGAFGVVGVGTDWSNFEHNAETDVAAYVSHDGLAWTRSATAASFKDSSMGAVAAGGPGVVAIGNGPSSLEAWTSADGASWTETHASDTLGTGEARDMVVHNSMLVTVGRDSSGAVAWTSSDGTTWTRTSSQTDALKGALMERLAQTSQNIFAAGKDDSGAGSIWSSADGMTWAKADSLPGASRDLSAIAASATTVVVFGTGANGSVVLLRGQAGS